MHRSQDLLIEQLLELALVVPVELLRQVVGHVGHDSGPHVGVGVEGPHLRSLVVAAEAGQVDLNLRDLHHRIEESSACSGDCWSHERPSHGSEHDSEDWSQSSQGESRSQTQVLPANKNISEDHKTMS